MKISGNFASFLKLKEIVLLLIKKKMSYEKFY